jgi:hypothetical protein
MFNAHSHLGNSISPKFLLPSDNGSFEMDADIEPANDFLISLKTGEDTFEKYGITENKSSVVLIYISKYNKDNIAPIITSFMERNTTYVASPSSLRVYDNIRNKLPSSFVTDKLQICLVGCLSRQYTDQAWALKKSFEEAGVAYLRSKDANQAAIVKRKREEKAAFEKEAKAKERRIESQLKGLTGEEREAALRSVIRPLLYILCLSLSIIRLILT